MHLELSNDDILVLKHALDEYLVSLRDQLGKTGSTEYHLALRNDLERLEDIHRRLKELLAGSPITARRVPHTFTGP